MSYPKANISIRSPHEFSSVLRNLKRAIAEGRLLQFVPTDAGLALADIVGVKDEGPWPDYVEAYFADPNTNAKYKLSVETYHGAGGTWERM